MWLMHKSGFTAVRLLSRNRDLGKVTIRLEVTGEQATVDEDDVELVRDTFHYEKIFVICFILLP